MIIGELCNFKNKRLKYLLTALVVVICGAMIWILNKFTPMYGDDYNYSFIMGVYPWQRMTSITQLPLSMYNHFFIAKCGKIFTNGLAQIFLLLPSSVFDVINTLGFLVMLLITAYHASGTLKNISLRFYIVAFLILILEAPAFGQSYLWIDGASNYLYGPSLILAFLIPYRVKYERMSGRTNVLAELIKAILMLVFGFVAGWTNENTSLALSIMIIGFIITYHFKKVQINIWNITGVIGSMTGLAFLLLGPGEQERLADAGGSGDIVAWIKRFFLISFNLVEYMQLILLIIALISVYMFVKKQKFNNPLLAIYSIGLLASIYSMVASPVFPDRTWSGPFLLALIVMGLLANMVIIEEKWIFKVASITMALGIVIGLGVYINGYFALKNAYVYYDTRLSIIEEAKSEGKTSVTLPIIRGKSRFVPYSYNGDITENPEDWLNHSIAEYYGFDEVIGQ